jgi:broad specificity phosphatase PhoE
MRWFWGLAAGREGQCALPTILLIRHAQGSFGTSDYDALSEVGRRQAVALGEALQARQVEPDRVLRSSLRRVRDTMQLCQIASGSVVTVDPRLDEYDHADLFGNYAPQAVPAWQGGREAAKIISSGELQALLDQALWRWVDDAEDSPCKESWPEFRARALGALSDLTASLGRGEQALVFTSAGITAAICAHLLRGSADAFVALNRAAVNTGITKLGHGRAGTNLISFNGHSHLEGTDPTLLTYR